jgi:hypothetical protein
MTRTEWLKQAKPKTVTVDKETMTLEPREFSTGTVGWYFNGKMNGGTEQVQLSIFVVGSKHWSE